ncbi:MAG: hypothetical protein RR536_01735 [Anaerovoracaceae bacterium]
MVDIKTGKCKSTRCNIHDDEYIKNRKMQIAKLRKETETQKEEIETQKEEIETQKEEIETQKEETEKEKLIKRKYEEARQLYKIGKTNRAQEVEKEIIKLKKETAYSSL